MRFGRRLLLLSRAVRAPFLLATVIPVTLGAAVAMAETHRLSPSLLLLSLVGCVALHAGANAANDYYDWLSGADTAHDPWKYSGGSQVLQSGSLTPRQVRRIYHSLYMVALLVGIYIAWQVGLTALLIGLVGLALGHWYTAPPMAFSYHGLGEVVTGLTFGPLVVSGSYFVQAGRLGWRPVLVSLPVGLLITAVLYINEFPDLRRDAWAGKSNWVVLTDAKWIWIYQVLISSAVLLALVTLVQVGPWFILIGLPLTCLAVKPLLHSRLWSPECIAPLQSGTLRLHTVAGLSLAFAYFIAGLR